MTKKEKLCLEMRNQNDKENEIFCQHYQKKFGGYLFHTFFGFENLSLLVVCIVFTLISVFALNSNSDFYFRIIFYSMTAFIDLLWIFFIFKALWFWKYSKHVFITNQGIWIMHYSTFWWQGAKDFMGKRKFLAPSWSLYGWSELKKVTDNKKDLEKSRRDITDLFEAYDDFIIKITGLKTIYLTRFDGVEKIDFLTELDSEEILNSYKTYKKSKRKSKKTIKEENSNEEETTE